MAKQTQVKSTNLTEGSPIKGIMLFAIPLFISNIFQQFYAVADSFIVSKALGVDAFAAVGSTAPLNALIPGFALGISSGFGIMISHYFGAREGDGVRRSFFSGLFLSLVSSIILSIVFLPFTKPMLQLIQTPNNLLDDATTYLRILFAGIIVTTLYNYLLISIRALGNGITPLIFLVFSSVLNVGLDILFVMQWNWGVNGAAFSVIFSQLIASILCFIYIAKRVPILVTRASFSDITKIDCKNQLHIGLPIGLMNLIIAVGTTILQFSLNRLGSDAVAAYSAAIKIDPFATNFLASIGICVGTFVAQNYGAKQYQRIKDGTKHIAIIFIIYSICIGLIMIFFGAQFANLMVGPLSPDIMQMCKIYFLVNSSCYIFLCLVYITRYTLQGIGKHQITTFAGLIETIMRIIASFLASAFLGFVGISLAAPLAWAASLVPLFYTYSKAMHMLTMRQKMKKNP